VLKWLADSGWQSYSLGATIFDGRYEYPTGQVIGPEATNPAHKGKWLELDRDGVKHLLFNTQSTQGRHLTRDEAQRVVAGTEERLARIKPDVILGYGQDSVSQTLWKRARRHTKALIFYLANANYSDSALFSEFDKVLCPSAYLAQSYSETLGITADVFPTPVDDRMYSPPEDVMPVAHSAARRDGFITFVNPVPEKGATLVFQLIKLAAQERPDLTFLVLEGRLSGQWWRDAGADIADMPNVWWLGNQQDMRPVYRRTSILLFPSFWPEATGRGIKEAQLGGIPVLATNRGGIPEQLNGGGFLFEVPDGCMETYTKIPPREAVRPWLDTLCRLMDDEDAYREASQRALRAAEPFRPETRKREIVAFFDQIVSDHESRKARRP